MAFAVAERTNRFVMCNPDRCIGCYTCMAACYQSAKERGKVAKPRLILVHTFDGSMPNQCRQCEDAPCANVCPVGALEFGKDHIEIHEEMCIGCKMCVMVCPFGAIRPVAESMPSVDYHYEPDINKLLGVPIGEKVVAIKCDLCEGREGGPACVEVCPTKALMYITPDTMENKTIDSKEKRAVASLVKYVREEG